MLTPLEIADLWGSSHFQTASPALLEKFRIPPADCDILQTVGLPIGPESSLKLNLRFANVRILHAPTKIGFLSQTSFEKSSHYPRTGDPAFDAWADLDHFVVLGTVPDDFPPNGPHQISQFLCLDIQSRRIIWVWPQVTRGKTSCSVINSDLPAYLASLLAYKQFRDQRPALTEEFGDADEETASSDPAYQAKAGAMHAEFLATLEAADPAGFKGGFWEEHAWNEAILLEV